LFNYLIALFAPSLPKSRTGVVLDHEFTEIYLIIDEFFKESDNIIRKHLLLDTKTKLF